MTTITSVELIKPSVEGPDSDGDVKAAMPVILENRSDSFIDLILAKTWVINADGYAILSSSDEQSEHLAPGEKGQLEVRSGWFKRHLLGYSPSAEFMLDIKACKTEVVKVPSIQVGEGGPGLYGMNTTINLGSQVELCSLAISIGKLDDDGESRVEVKALIRNKTETLIPRMSFRVKAFTAKGREIDDRQYDEALSPNEMHSIEVIFYGIKANRLEGASFEAELTLFSTVDSLRERQSFEFNLSESGEYESDDSSSNDLAHRVYIKTEPGGRICFGRIDADLIPKLLESLEKKEMDEEVLDLRLNSSGDFREVEGVINSGDEGDSGNEGLIVIHPDGPISVPVMPGSDDMEDGVYMAYLSLSKVSIEFEFTPNDGEDFDPDRFSEISVPIQLPDFIEHSLYGKSEFNVVTGYRYNDELIEEYEGDLTDRGYDDQTIIFMVRSGEVRQLYRNYNGDEEWLVSAEEVSSDLTML